MPKKTRHRPLLTELSRRRPDLDDPENCILQGLVMVEGFVNRNPKARISTEASIAIAVPQLLRGTLKLRAAFESFNVSARGKVALDVGAAAGGFTVALLEAEAARVYAVEVGYGQLLGSLRQNPKVIHLERTNIAALTQELVPDAVDIATLDVGYLALAVAVPQLNRLRFAKSADLIALVKPTAELGLGHLPTEESAIKEATSRAIEGIEHAGWTLVASIESPLRGTRGAIEVLVHATRIGGASV